MKLKKKYGNWSKSNEHLAIPNLLRPRVRPLVDIQDVQAMKIFKEFLLAGLAIAWFTWAVLILSDYIHYP